MPKSGFPIYLLSIFSLILSACNPSVDLFDENMSQWEEFGEAQWKMENGELSGSIEEGVGFFVTKEKFKDFELNVQFKPDSSINSGIYIRCQNKELSFEDCYEINIWDLHPNQDFRTGSVVNRAKPLAHVETIDEWNDYRIKIEGTKINAWVNGVMTVDLENQDLQEGYIAIQAMGEGNIAFRNFEIQVLNE